MHAKMLKIYWGGSFSLARKKLHNVTKAGIVRVATQRFMQTGYSGTTVKSISDELGISTGHVTFYYPSKERLLSILTQMLCDFQWKMMSWLVDEGEDALTALCVELMSMAAICEENPIAKDFYLSAYTHPMPLEIIRRNDAARAKNVFAEYCPCWTDAQFAEAETLVSGIEYATLMTTGDSQSIEVRISGALDEIMKIYGVPPDVRHSKIGKSLSMDYRGIGRRILKEFMEYIDQVNEQVIDDLPNLP